MDISNLEELKINQFEYCYVAEDTPLPASSVKVTIAKLCVSTNKQTVRPQSSILINDSECKPQATGTIKLLDTITVKTFSGLELSKSAVIKKSECGCYVSDHKLVKNCLGKNDKFIDGHITSAYLPKGAKMIVCFMNGDVNDGYLTNFL